MDPAIHHGVGRAAHQCDGRHTINGVCCAAPIVLSLSVLMFVGQGLWQYGLHPPVDDGAHAFLFMLLLLVQLPLIVAFAATADWTARLRSGAIVAMHVLCWVGACTAVYAWGSLAATAV